jgi:hypothetical protein
MFVPARDFDILLDHRHCSASAADVRLDITHLQKDVTLTGALDADRLVQVVDARSRASVISS